MIRLKKIHYKGFLPTITKGDAGVGDTLENALGISRNNSSQPDYKGIELKTTRISRDGKSKVATRSTLFTKVPDEGLSYREIIDKYGKFQIPKGKTEARLQLYETFSTKRVNAYDLTLEVDEINNKLKIIYVKDGKRTVVSAWNFDTLQESLSIKHKETFWVKAESKIINGIECFRYDKILYTRKPNSSLLIPLIEEGIITIDLAAHYKPDGKWRDHGVLFKMKPKDIHLLLGIEKEISFVE